LLIIILCACEMYSLAEGSVYLVQCFENKVVGNCNAHRPSVRGRYFECVKDIDRNTCREETVWETGEQLGRY
jgi:hypothetical protein